MQNSKPNYTEDFKERTAKYIIENEKAATRVADEIGVGKNTVCRWVKEYCLKNNLPDYCAREKSPAKKGLTDTGLLYQLKEMEKELKRKDKELKEEREKVEILKCCLHIFMQPRE